MDAWRTPEGRELRGATRLDRITAGLVRSAEARLRRPRFRDIVRLPAGENEMADQVRASHILLMYRGSSRSSATRSKEDASTSIASLKAQIDSGADFAELARAHSDCPSSAKGGDLGSFGRGQMVRAFEDAAYSLPVGGTSDVVETQFGYHIIRRTG